MRDPKTARTIPVFVRALAEAYGDKPAVVLGDDVLTYRELERRSAVLALGLMARGAGKGNRIGFLLGNSPEWVVTWAAIARMGAVAVPLSTFSKPPELARILRHGDVQGVIAQHRFLSQDFVRSLGDAFPEARLAATPALRLAAAPHLRWIAFTGAVAPPPWAHDLAWLESRAGQEGFDDELLRAAEAEVHPDEPAMMIYTSGQSADPKGVLHSHSAILSKIHYLRYMLGIGPEDRNESTMPFFWIGGLVMTLFTTLEAGGTVACGEGPTIGVVFGTLSDTRPRPTYPDPERRVGLGMSETFGIYSWGNADPHPARPLCTPLVTFEPGYSVKVVDGSGQPVPDGGRGEILVRGPSVTIGLHKVDRAKSFDPDGFYRTGDEGELDGDAIYFVGRLGDMIKTSGANVTPAEVERELLGLNGVAAAYVVGVDDETRGQVVGAAVVPGEGAELDASSILDALRSRLSSYKVPRLLVFLSQDEVPVTPTSKLLKRDLARLIWSRSADRRVAG